MFGKPESVKGTRGLPHKPYARRLALISIDEIAQSIDTLCCCDDFVLSSTPIELAREEAATEQSAEPA